MTGQPKLRLRLSPEVLRQASSGPTPVRKRSASPTGIIIFLKNGAATVMGLLVNHSEKTGKSVPERTAMEATRKSGLLKRKLDSPTTASASARRSSTRL